MSARSVKFILLSIFVRLGIGGTCQGTSRGSQGSNSTQSTNSTTTFPQAQMATMPCSQARMPYALDSSALGLVSSGFLSPASRLNAGWRPRPWKLCECDMCLGAKTIEGRATAHEDERRPHYTASARTMEGCAAPCARER